MIRKRGEKNSLSLQEEFERKIPESMKIVLIELLACLNTVFLIFLKKIRVLRNIKHLLVV